MKAIAPKRKDEDEAHVLIHEDSARSSLSVETPDGFPLKVFDPRIGGLESIDPVVEHTEKSTEICIREVQGDTKAHKRMIIGFENGTVAVWEWPSRKEHAKGNQPLMLAELRSMTFSEMMIP